MRRTKEQAAATRQAILDAALEVFGRRGFSAAGLEDIAKRAGVTRGAVYWHFDNKLALYTSLIEQAYERVCAGEAEILAFEASPIEKLRLMMTVYLRHLATDPWFRAIERVSVFNLGKTDELVELTEQANVFIRGRRAMLATLISEGVEAGELRTDLEPQLMASGAVSYLYGIEMSWLSDEELYPLESSLEGLVELYLDGLKTTSSTGNGDDHGEA